MQSPPAMPPGSHSLLNDVYQLLRGSEGMPSPGLNHQAGQAPGPRLFPIFPKNLFQSGLGGPVEQMGRGHPAVFRVEPHVQGLISLEGKAPLGSLQLPGGQAQVQEDAGHPGHLGFCQQLPQLTIRTMKQLKSGGVVRQPGGGRRQDGGVSIQPPKAPVRGAAVQDGRGMPPLTHGAIHIQAARPAIEAHQHLLHHNRFVNRIRVCG